VGDRSIVALHNLGPEPLTVPLTLPGLDDVDDARLVDLLADASTPIGPRGAVRVVLDGYGHRWLRVVRPRDGLLL
jgi:hypothetical protein